MRALFFIFSIIICKGSYEQSLIPKPIPNLQVTSSNINSLSNPIKSYNISIGGDPNTLTSINSSQNITAVADKTINIFENTIISANGSGKFLAYINNTLDLVWIEPNSTPGNVVQYERLELGIKFSDDIENEINNFISNTVNTNNLNPFLNPFDPNDIDIKAEFSIFDGFNTYQFISLGFYYEEFAHNAALTNWIMQPNDYRFRIRFTPRIAGLCKCKIIANIKGFGTITTSEFTFC